MMNVIKLFEKFTIIALMIMMMIAILFGTIELGMLLFRELFNKHPMFLLDIKKLLDIFGFFFMILIGLELLETIKTYLTRSQVHVEIVLLVAMIAISRKVIILDIKSISAMTLIGIASIIVALAGGYFMVKMAHLKQDLSLSLKGKGQNKL
jgi:uncharacterized membrane protein (DUF373 family)